MLGGKCARFGHLCVSSERSPIGPQSMHHTGNNTHDSRTLLCKDAELPDPLPLSALWLHPWGLPGWSPDSPRLSWSPFSLVLWTQPLRRPHLPSLTFFTLRLFHEGSGVKSFSRRAASLPEHHWSSVCTFHFCSYITARTEQSGVGQRPGSPAKHAQ